MTDKSRDVEAIYSVALEKQSDHERSAYLDGVCGDDHALRARVEALLKANRQAGSFLQVPDGKANVTLDDPVRIEGPGTRIGRYELLALIGEGGMGLVYLAEQKEPVKRKVALKIIKPGMDSRQVIARFEAERQALAVLDHPNIAHVFDAGTTETGRPYFVMEYVKGMSITGYCDQNKLSIEQRLRLFEQVCEGIHHAHQKGIIHRDLKPSNVLVSVHGDRAVPKIIDFGIAKAVTKPLTEKTFVTFQGQLLGTPEYMSPEQVDFATQDIDTRSDIYSLGVVLYELLAGVLPFERESLSRLGFAEVQRTIREQEPATPSVRLTKLGEEAKTIAASRGTQAAALARRLHRELEWIPLKAMRKDRCRRYKSASEMADDIRNYLNGNPLVAGPETTAYRVKKFVHKHVGSVATILLVAAAIIGGLIVSTALYFRAERALSREVIARSQAEGARKKETIARAEAEQAKKVAEDRAEDYRRSLYFNHIALAHVAYRSSDISHLLELLNACPEDLRAWEWYYLDKISDQACLTRQVGHIGEWLRMALSPDGKRIASGGKNNTIEIWDATTGIILTTLRGHEEAVGPLCFSPDGDRLVSASRDCVIKVWDITLGTEVAAFKGHDDIIWTVGFSPDGKRVISGGRDSTIKVWEVRTGKELMTLRGHTNRVYGATFGPEGKRIISAGGDGKIKIWDAADGSELMSLEGNKKGVFGAALSPDGKFIASGGDDNVIMIWDAESGEELMKFRGHERGVGPICFSSDNKQIASGGMDNTVRVWDVESGDELKTFRGHRKEIWSVAFSPDCTRIVSSSRDETIKVWDLTVERERVTLDHGSTFFSPDCKQMLGNYADGGIVVLDVASGTDVMTLDPDESYTYSAAFSPDGKRIIADGKSGTIRVWDRATGTKLMTLKGHDDEVHSVIFSPDSSKIISGGKDKMIKVWDAITGKELMALSGHTDRVWSLAASPSGNCFASGSWDNTVRIWNTDTGENVMTLKGHAWYVGSVAFSPDGKRLVSSDIVGSIRVWDLASGEQITTLSGHTGSVWSVAFSPDGRRIVSGGTDHTVRLWDAQAGSEVMIFQTDTGRAFNVGFSPDGRTLAVGAGATILWESATPADGYEARRTGGAAKLVVEKSHHNYGLYSEVIDKVINDRTLEESVRKLALQIASARLWKDGKRTE